MIPSSARPALLCGILVTQGLFPSPATAAENGPGATPFSDTVAVISATAETPAGESFEDQSASQALADRDKFAATIAALESRDEIYGTPASEAYLGYANALHKLDLDEEALQSYGKALQALRVGNGLYDTQQIPVLQQQALVQESLAQWEALDASRHLIYHLARRRMPAGAETRFDALLQLTRWKFKAAQRGLLAGNTDQYAESADLYGAEIAAIEQRDAYAGKNIQLGLLYLELAAVEFQQAKYKYSLPITAFQTISQPRSFSRVECQTARMPDGRLLQICDNVEQTNMDFYMAPTIKKSQDVNQHLNNMKNAVISAYELLQQDTAYPEDRKQLLAEVHKLTNAYNAFNTEGIK